MNNIGKSRLWWVFDGGWERLTKGTKYGSGMPAGAFLKFIKEREKMLEGK